MTTYKHMVLSTQSTVQMLSYFGNTISNSINENNILQWRAVMSPCGSHLLKALIWIRNARKYFDTLHLLQN